MATLAEWKTTLKEANPSLTKMVNGNSIDLSTDEYNATIDEWAQASFDQEVETALIADGGQSAKYAQYRRDAYPSIGDQLDMQYKDAANSTTTWADAIAAVKTKYAKPSQYEKNEFFQKKLIFQKKFWYNEYRADSLQ